MAACCTSHRSPYVAVRRGVAFHVSCANSDRFVKAIVIASRPATNMLDATPLAAAGTVLKITWMSASRLPTSGVSRR